MLHISLIALLAMLAWLSAQEVRALTAKQCAALCSSWDNDRNDDIAAGGSHDAQPATATEAVLAAATEPVLATATDADVWSPKPQTRSTHGLHWPFYGRTPAMSAILCPLF
jgi:hypothetical protein